MSTDVFHDNFFAMGTRLDAVFWGVDQSFAQSVFNKINEETDRLEADLSHFDPRSPITAINKNAGIKAVPAPHTVLSALNHCHRHFRKTLGLFDVTVAKGSAPKDFRTNTFEPGTANELNSLKIFEDQGTVYLEKRGKQIDLGGIGKGIALEQIEEILRQYEIENALVSFGESSILTRGRHPHGHAWKIGISDINNKNESHYSFELNNHALSTSGNTPHNEGHIRNPFSGFPQQTYHTVSVLTDSPVEAEVLSTALLLADNREERRILNEYHPYRAVRINYGRDGQLAGITELQPSYFS